MTLHYAAGGGIESNGQFSAGQYGFNLADVQSVEQLNALPPGVKGLVWLDQAKGVTQSFINEVQQYIGNPKLYGFYLADEPDPTGKWGPLVKAEDLKAESDWIHANAPGAKTFIVMMDMGSSTSPNFTNTYNPANTHIDYFGIDPYPVRSGSGQVDYSMIGKAVAAAVKAGIPVDQIVPVYQTFGGGGWTNDQGGKYVMPTAQQAQTMISEWATCLAHFDTDGSVLSADPLQDHTATNILDAVQDEAGVIYTVSLLSLPVVIGVNSFTSAGGFDVVLGAVVGTSGVEGLRLGGIADEWGGKLRTSGNGLVMAGSFADVMSVGSDILTSSGGLDMYITRMSTGTLDVSRPYVDRTGLLLAPNPVGERATLCIPKELQREPVRLFDHAGRCLRTFSPGHPQLSLDITGLASGTYLLRCGPSTIVLVKE